MRKHFLLLPALAIAFSLTACTTSTTKDTVTTNGVTVSKETNATTVVTPPAEEVPKTTLKNANGKVLEFTPSANGESVLLEFEDKRLNLIRQKSASGAIYAGEGGYEFITHQKEYTLTYQGNLLFEHKEP